MNTTGSLKAEVRKVLEEVCKKNGWGTTDSDFAEVLSEGKEVYSEIGYSHRWYDEELRVVEVDGNLFMFDDYHITGDNSKSDMDLDFDLSSVNFCEAYQVTVTKYCPLE